MRQNIFMMLVVFVALTAFTGLAFGQMGQQAAPNDNMIKAQISKAIQANPKLSIGNINVDSKNGNVTLSGKVISKVHEQQIIDIAKSTPGVKSVNSKIVVYQQE